MPIAVTAVLFIFWMAMAYRAFERGDTMLTVVFLLVGVVLTAYRYRIGKKAAEQATARKSETP
jgi:hypothetical protein